jgi:hypothetical protein
VEFISGFNSCSSLTEVKFGSDSRVQEMHDFNVCKSLCELEIPSSVEIMRGFNTCLELQKITFLPNSRLRVIMGFRNCLIRSMEIPASVETIGDFFDGLCRKLSAQKEQESK